MSVFALSNDPLSLFIALHLSVWNLPSILEEFHKEEVKKSRRKSFSETKGLGICVTEWPHVIRLSWVQNEEFFQFYSREWVENMKDSHRLLPQSKHWWVIRLVVHGSPLWQKWHAWSKAARLPTGCLSVFVPSCDWLSVWPWPPCRRVCGANEDNYGHSLFSVGVLFLFWCTFKILLLKLVAIFDNIDTVDKNGSLIVEYSSKPSMVWRCPHYFDSHSLLIFFF